MTATTARAAAKADKTTGTREFQGMILRCLRKYGPKVDSGQLPDIDALVQLREIQAELDEQTAQVVRALRSEAGGAHSWAEIGAALGIGRAAAFKRYGAAESDVRQVGGQPSALR
jgi:hypothetical protein